VVAFRHSFGAKATDNAFVYVSKARRDRAPPFACFGGQPAWLVDAIGRAGIVGTTITARGTAGRFLLFAGPAFARAESRLEVPSS